MGKLTVATVWEKKCSSFLAIVNHLYVYPSSEAKPPAPPGRSSLPGGNTSEPSLRRASSSNHTAALISTWQLPHHPPEEFTKRLVIRKVTIHDDHWQ